MTEILRLAAFTTDPSGGNPAGVVLDADDLDAARRQEIAAEVGYSETAFATSHATDRGRFRLRFYSPLAEVDFCGHATIATAVAIAERDGEGPLTFDTAVGDIEVSTTRTGHGLVATLRSVATRSRPAASSEVAAALDALRWSADDLAPQLPPHIAYAGNEHLVLAVRTRERLAELDYDFDVLKDLMLDRGWTTLQLFFRQDETTIHSRNPFPVGGVVEDPATGAAAAAWGATCESAATSASPRRLWSCRARTWDGGASCSSRWTPTTRGSPSRARLSGCLFRRPTTLSSEGPRAGWAAGRAAGRAAGQALRNASAG